jgi:hypothetical protein
LSRRSVAASSRRRRSSSSAASVSVPGVTMRTTLRSTGPFAGGRVADLLADRHRLAELHQLGEVGLDRVKGTPAILIGVPADWRRASSA